MKRPRFVVIHAPPILPTTGEWAVFDTSKKYKAIIGHYSRKEEAEDTVRKLNRRSHHSEETR